MKRLATNLAGGAAVLAFWAALALTWTAGGHP
jgi:hypothetical protein